MAKIDPDILLFNRWVFCKKETLQKSLDHIDEQISNKKREWIIIGREIGELNVCRFAKEHCSEPKFKEFAEKFNYDKLNDKYPINPLLEKPHGKE